MIEVSGITTAAAGGNREIGYRIETDGSAPISFAAAGDVDLDGAVNVFDLVGVNAAGRYGTGGPAVVPVPEPAAVSVAVILAVGLAAPRRRRG